jgi:transcriptional regulator with XRE-family HTH domain
VVTTAHDSSAKVRSSRTADDFNRLSMEVLRAMRGAQSQSAMSRRLGYASNVYYQWESGRRIPALTDVMKVASLGHRSPVGTKMAQKLQKPEGFGAMIAEMSEEQSLMQLADVLEISRSALSRWRSGKSVPTFPKFLHLVDLCTGRVIDFVELFADPHDLPSVADEWHRISRFRALANLMPICIPTLSALKLADYLALPTHDDAWLAHRLGVSRDEMTFALERIGAEGAIRFNGTHYEAVRDCFDLFVSAPEILQRLQFQTEVTGFYVGTTSHEVAERARLKSQNLLMALQDMVEAERDSKEQVFAITIRIGRLDRSGI